MWWLVQDIVKVQLWRLMKVHNFLGVNETGKVVYSKQTLAKIEKMRIDLASSSAKSGHGGH